MNVTKEMKIEERTIQWNDNQNPLIICARYMCIQYEYNTSPETEIKATKVKEYRYFLTIWQTRNQFESLYKQHVFETWQQLCTVCTFENVENLQMFDVWSLG